MDIGRNHIEYTRNHLRKQNIRNVGCMHMGYADFSRVHNENVNKIYSPAVFIHFNLWDIVNYLYAIYEILPAGGMFHFNIMEAEKIDLNSNEHFQKNLNKYRHSLSSRYLVTWNSFQAISNFTEQMGFNCKRTHEWKNGNSGLLLTKK